MTESITSDPEEDLDQVSPGDRITIDGYEYEVGSKTVDVSKGGVLKHFVIMSTGYDELTGQTVSRLKVDRKPYELKVCNGPTHKIDPEKVNHDGQD